jgi:hypothetical protein
VINNNGKKEGRKNGRKQHVEKGQKTKKGLENYKY